MRGPRHRHRRRGGRSEDARPPLPEVATLDNLPIGARGIVLSINGERKLRRRLMEMGLLEGSILRVVKFAPTGDPIQVKVNDYFLSLRRADAANVVVNTKSDCRNPQDRE